MLPTRVEKAPKGEGGWALVADSYAQRVDFNQSSLTLYREMDGASERAGTATGGSQPHGSQTDAPPVGEHTEPVDVLYTKIRCIKRGASASSALCLRTVLPRMLLRSRALAVSLPRIPADTSSGSHVTWTIGLNAPLADDEDDEDDDGEAKLSEDAVAERAKARAAALAADAAITLKFERALAAPLETCVVPLIFKANPVRVRSNASLRMRTLAPAALSARHFSRAACALTRRLHARLRRSACSRSSRRSRTSKSPPWRWCSASARRRRACPPATAAWCVSCARISARMSACCFVS